MDEFARGGTMEGLGGPVRMDSVNSDWIDPTLDSCCQREVESNRYHNALTRTMQRHDVVAMKERRRRHLVQTPEFIGCRCCYDPNSDGGGDYTALIELRQQRMAGTPELGDNENNADVDGGKREFAQQEEEKKVETGNDDDSDDEFDYLLDEFDEDAKEAEDRRRAELEFAMYQREIALQHGYGVHRYMHPTRVLRAAGLGWVGDKVQVGRPPAVVIHLVDPESVASASLDLYLEELAGIHNNNNTSFSPVVVRGTKFMRSGGRSVLLMDADLATKVLPKLLPDRDLPALVAIRDGVVVNVCPNLRGLTSNLNKDPVDEDAVYQWLDRSGVLLPQPPQMEALCRIRPEEDALMDYLEASKAAPPREEPERYDCGNPLCSKPFPHEHVGMQNEVQSGLVVSEEAVLGEAAGEEG